MNVEAQPMETAGITAAMGSAASIETALREIAGAALHGLSQAQLHEWAVRTAARWLFCPVTLFWGSASREGTEPDQLWPQAAWGMELSALPPLATATLQHYGAHERSVLPDAAMLPVMASALGLPITPTALLLTPLRQSNGRVVGALCALHLEPERGFSATAQLLLEVLAARLASHLETRQTYQGLEEDYGLMQQRLQALHAMYELSLDLARRQHDLESLLQSVGQRLMELLDATGGGVWLWREDAQQLELVISLQVDYTVAVGALLSPGEGLVGQAYLTRQITVRNDYAEWSDRPALFREAPFRAAMAIPLLWQEQVFGVLAVTDNREGRVFGPHDQYVGQLVASQVAVFVQNAQLFQQLRQTLTRTESLYRASRLVMTLENVEAVLQAVVEGVSDALGAEEVVLYTFDLAREQITHTARRGRPLPAGYAPSFTELRQGLSGWVMEHLQPALSPKGYLDPREGPEARLRRERNRTGAVIVVPLLYRGALLGTLTAFNSMDGPDFTQQDVELMLALANQAAAAVANAQLFRDVQRALKRTQALYQVGRAVMLLQDPATLFQEIVTQIAETLPANRVALITFDIEAQRVTHFVRGGPGQDYINPTVGFAELWDGLSGWALREGQPALSPKGIPDPRESPAVQQRRLETRCGAIMVVPIQYRGTTLGTMTAINLPEEPDFTEDDLDLMLGMVNQVAAAIANAQLFAAVQRRALLLSTGAEISRAAHSILDIDTLLTEVVTLIQERFELYYVGIFLVDESGEWAVLRSGTGEAGRRMLADGHRLQIGGQSMIGSCIASRQARIALDVGAEAVRFDNPVLPRTRSEMALPLISRGEAIGAMTIQSEQAGAFSADDILMLQTMADQVANAIANARLFTEVRRAALLAESQQILLQSVIDAIPNPVFYKDAQGAYQILNRAFAEEVLGLPAAHIIGKTVYELPEVIPPAKAEEFHAADLELVYHPGVQRYETRVRFADGLEHEVAFSKATVFDAQGAVAGIVGVMNDITARKQLLAALEQRTQQLQTAAEISRATSSILRLEELLPQAVELIRQQFGYYYVGIFLIDDTQTWAVLRAGTGAAGAQMLAAGHRLRIGGHSMVGMAMALREPRIAVDVGQEAVRFDNPLLPDTRSELALPLISRGDVIGALTIQSERQQAFSESDILVLQTVADQIANAIANAWLFAEAQERFEELQRLQRYLTGEAWSQFVRGHDVLGYVYDTTQLLPLVDSAMETPESAGSLWRQRELERVEALQRGDIVLEQDEAGAFVMAPITSPLGEPLGVLGVDVPLDEASAGWSAEDLELIQAVREQIGLALENRLLFEQTSAVLTETTTLYEVGQQIAEAHSIAEILQAMIAGLSKRPEPDRIIVGFFEPVNVPTHLRVLDGWVRDGAPVRTDVTYPLTHWQAVYAALESQGRFICADVERVAEFDDAVRAMFQRLGVRGMAAFQLRVRGATHGALLIYTLEPHEFTPEELRFYTTLAQNTSVALENQFLLETTRQEAERRALLNEVMSTASASLDPEDLVHDTMQLIAQRLGMPVLYWKYQQGLLYPMAIYRFDGSALVPETETGYPPEDVPELTEAVVSHFDYRWRFATLPFSWGPFEPFRAELDLEEALVMPVMIRDEVLGVMVLGQQRGHPPIDENETAFLRGAAVNIGVALENAQLYQDAQETAEKLKEVDRLKSEFLANMSHELRTPLNSIIGFSRVILKGIDGPITDLQKTDLEAIYQSGRHLLELINEILDHSKIEAGKMEYVFEPVDLLEIIRGIMSTSIALVKDKPIELQQRVPDTLPTIIADARRIRQVLLNLMGNAAKFTERGFISLSASYDDKWVTIAVQDSGVGIPKDRYASVFKPFEQVDSSSSRRFGGTGLGLPVSKKFVEAHGGDIWFESEEGIGSTFFVKLPIAGPSQEKPSDQAAQEAQRAEALESKGKLVLTVDDDAGVITLFRRYLASQGYRVIGLTRGDRVVEEARRLRPYAITLDILMPDRSGWEVIRDLKSDPVARNIPIIVCSIVSERDKGLSMGVADYLVKPILEQDLLSALERLARDPAQRKVLVVDDNPDDRNLLQRILTNAGYQVSLATNGVEAIAALTASRPDLVLLDLMMPEVDGFAVLEHMKSRVETRDIPVVVVTAKELTVTERAELTARVQALLQKGLFNQERLLNDVAAALARLASSRGPA